MLIMWNLHTRYIVEVLLTFQRTVHDSLHTVHSPWLSEQNFSFFLLLLPAWDAVYKNVIRWGQPTPWPCNNQHQDEMPAHWGLGNRVPSSQGRRWASAPAWSLSPSHFAVREWIVFTAQPRFTRHLATAAWGVPTKRLPHRVRVQSHHTCKVLSTLFTLTQCWLKIITITINCSKPYHSFYIPLQSEKVPAANTWYISSPALSPLMEGTTAARLLSTLRWLQPSLQWHKKAEEERGKGGPTTQQHPKGVTAFPQD